MAGSFMEASTMIDGYASEIDDISTKIGNQIASIVSSKAGELNQQALKKELAKLLTRVPEGVQTDALIAALVALGKNKNPGGGSKPNKKRGGSVWDNDEYGSFGGRF